MAAEDYFLDQDMCDDDREWSNYGSETVTITKKEPGPEIKQKRMEGESYHRIMGKWNIAFSTDKAFLIQSGGLVCWFPKAVCMTKYANFYYLSSWHSKTSWQPKSVPDADDPTVENRTCLFCKKHFKSFVPRDVCSINCHDAYWLAANNGEDKMNGMFGNIMSKDGMSKMSRKMMEQQFKVIDNVVWDFNSGNIGVANASGIATLNGSGEDAEISINLFEEFGLPIPAFAMNTPWENVKEGDLVYNAGRLKGWVTHINNKKSGDGIRSFTLITDSGTTSNWKPPKASIFGMGSGGVMVVQSLMTMMGGASNLNGMSGMMMPMMLSGMMDGGGASDMLMMMMFMNPQGQQTTTPAKPPTFIYVLPTGDHCAEGDDGAIRVMTDPGSPETVAKPGGMDMSNMMMPMMMAQMMGGGKDTFGSKRPGKGHFDN